MSKRRITVSLIAVLVLSFILLAVSFRTEKLAMRIKQAITGNLSQTLDTPVFIGDVRFQGLAAVELVNVSIEGRGDEGENASFLKSDSVRVAFDPLRYLITRDLLASIGRISIHAPFITLVQYADGSWNAPLPGRSDTPSCAPLPLLDLEAAGGRIKVSPAPLSPLPGVGTSAIGRARMKLSQNGLQIDAGIYDVAGGQGRASLKGVFLKDGGQADFIFSGLEDRIWGRSLAAYAGAGVVNGKGSGRLTLKLASGRWILDGGNLLINDGSIDLGKGRDPITLGPAHIDVDGKDLRLAGTDFTYMGSRMTAAGRIENYATLPLLNIGIQAKRADIGRLLPLFIGESRTKLDGEGGIDLKLRGNLSEWRLSGSVTGKRLACGKDVLRDFDVSLSYLPGGSFSIAGKAEYMGSPLLGRIFSGRDGISYKGSIRKLDMSRLPFFAGAGLKSVGPLNLEFEGKLSRQSVPITGSFAGGRGSLKGFSWKNIDGRFIMTGNLVRLNDVKLRTEAGLVGASAVLSGDEFSVAISGQELMPGRAYSVKEAADAKVNLRAGIKGPLLPSRGDMAISGSMELVGGSFGNYGLSGTQIEFAALSAGDTLILSRLVMKTGGGRLAGRGSIKNNHDIQLAFDIESLPMRALLGMAGGGTASYSGFIDGKAVLNGNLPSSSFNLGMEGVQTDPAGRKSTFDLALMLSDGTVRVKSALLKGEAGTIAASGSLGGKSGSRLSITGSNLDGKVIKSVIGGETVPEGRYHISATLSGSLKSPSLEATLMGRHLHYRKVAVDDLKANLAYAGGRLSVNELSFLHAAGRFTARNISSLLHADKGRIIFTGPLSGNIRGEISDPSAFGWKRLTLKSGRLIVQGSVAGNVEQPSIKGSVGMESGELLIQGIDFNALSASFTADREGISLVGLQGETAAGSLTGSGRVSLDNWALDRIQGRLAFVDWQLQNLALLPSDLVRNPTGTIDGEVSISGPIAAPEFIGDIRLDGGSCHIGPLGAPLTDIKGRLRLSAGSLDIAALQGRMGKGSVDISGSIALEGGNPSHLNLALASDKASVAIAPYFNGLVDAKLLIAGPIRSPLIEGSIFISNSRVSLAGFNGAGKGLFRPELNIKGNIGSGVNVVLSRMTAPVKGGIDISGSLTDLSLSPRGLVADFGLFKIPIKAIPV